MGPFIFLDTETTGVDASKDQIIEVALIRWEDGKITDRLEYLVNPHVPIPAEITLLTGIKDEDVRSAPAFSDVKHSIANFIGSDPIVGHNIAFDTGFLRSHHMEIKNAEIDTIDLARILLRKEKSYALEVLMKRYELPIRASHRAMADTETTVSFFEFILGRIAEISAIGWAKIEPVLGRTNWAGKLALEKPKKVKGKRLKVKGERLKVKCKEDEENKNEFWKSDVLKKFLAGDKILYESSAEIPFEELTKIPLLVAYESYRKRDELERAAVLAGLRVCKLKEPGFYISPKKFAEKIAEAQQEEDEIPFLLKIILWLEETKTGDREEITLEREEYGFFDFIADKNGTDVFYLLAKKGAEEADVILVHHFGLARAAIENLNQWAKEKRSLIITEASKLEDSFTQALKLRFTDAQLRPVFKDKTTMVWGMLGIFFDYFSPVEFGGFRGNVVLDSATCDSIQWQRFLGAMQNLPDCDIKNELIKAVTPEEGRVCWISSFFEELAVTNVPIFLGVHFQNITETFGGIVFQGVALRGDTTFALIKELFELDSRWIEVPNISLRRSGHDHAEESKGDTAEMRIILPENFPEPRSEGYFKKCIALFSEIIEENKGGVLLLLNSKKMVEAIYRAILPIFQPKGVRLLGLGVSGGAGKTSAMFLEDPKNSVLISTKQILPHIEELEDHINVIVFQQIPFDPPDDPLLRARGNQYANGFEQYSLPRAVIRFRDLIAELSRGNAKKTCYLLDSRILTREYGKFFI